MGCGGGEQDAIAVVAGGEEVMRAIGDGAEQREAVRSKGAKAGPRFEDRGGGELREELRGAGVEARNVSGMNGLVEAAVFDRGSYDCASGVRAKGARDDVDVRRSKDKIEGKGR